MTRRTSAILGAALGCARRGWPVLMLHGIRKDRCTCRNRDCPLPGAHPLDPDGMAGATTDRNIISSWWLECPHTNVGVVTGRSSGLIVLAVEGQSEGAGTLGLLEFEEGRAASTATALAGTRQLRFFQYSADEPLPSRKAVLPGVDLLGDDGYVIVPPSLSPGGTPCEWDSETAEGRLSFEHPPSWLMDVIERGPR